MSTRIPGQGADTRPIGGYAPQGASRGIRPTFSAVDKVGPNGCTGRTKAGKFCKARPVNGTTLCVGHSRVN